MQSIDTEIKLDDLMLLIHAEVQDKNPADHHIASMNSFLNEGVYQIITKLFAAEIRFKNFRDMTEEDKKISEIEVKVVFTDVKVTPPTYSPGRNASPEPFYPNMARMKSVNYSGNLYVNATITATAYMHDGTSKLRADTLTDFKLATIPIMVGSDLCSTRYLSRHGKKAVEEDPNDYGGYFIMYGNEWVIENLENIVNNTFHVYKNAYKKELARGNFLSKMGDAFENSYQIIIRFLNSGLITVHMGEHDFPKLDIPFYMFFRMLGMTSDKDIVSHICYGMDETDPITQQMMQIINDSYKVKLMPQLEGLRKEHDYAKIIDAMSMLLDANMHDPKIMMNARKNDETLRYLHNKLLGVLDAKFLPHIGVFQQHRIKKARFLGYLINKLLKVYMDILPSTDRDSFGNKRIHSAGTSFSKAFKTNFNFAVIMEIKKNLKKSFENNSFSNVKLASDVMNAIKTEDLENALEKSITTGDKSIKVKNYETTNRVSSQLLTRKNDMHVISVMRGINAGASASKSKQSERTDKMRRVHPSFIGYVDPTRSKDTGEGVGVNKEMSIIASVCGYSSSIILKGKITSHTDFIQLNDAPPNRIYAENLAKVFVNGDWLGCCLKAHTFAKKFRDMRRAGEIDKNTTIVWSLEELEVRFYTDFGRMMYPLIIVYNNAETRDEKTPFKQWIKLTYQHLKGIQEGTITMEQLVSDGIVEYISPEENENLFIARNLEVLRNDAENILNSYTHVAIEQSILSYVANDTPLAHCSSAVRTIYFGNHRKGSTGWFAMNYPFRMDKHVVLQYYAERSNVHSFVNNYVSPNGTNCIVALTTFEGYNQEDSVVVNKSSVHCGLYNASHYYTESIEIKKGEMTGLPNPLTTTNIKRDAIYDYLDENGIIKEGTIAQKGYVLVCKMIELDAKNKKSDFTHLDKSVICKMGPVFIDKVIISSKDGEKTLIKIRLRSNRNIIEGDKVASRTGNKGIVSFITDRSNLPYTEDGMVPDIIVNPQSVPNRMAINQLIECSMSILAARDGKIFDASPFKYVNAREIIQELKDKHNIELGGMRRLYNGRTGEWIDAFILIGPTVYQRLLKFVLDERYAMRSGPTDVLTRQPVGGKSNEGGLKFGEMEKDVVISHGTMRAFHEKFHEDSDGVKIYVCRNCAHRAYINESKNKYVCRICTDTSDIAEVDSSWVANLFFDYLAGMNVDLKFNLEKHEFA